MSASNSLTDRRNAADVPLHDQQGASGDNEWERAISLIDFNFTRPNGSDLSRQRGVLFSAKAKHQSGAAQNGGGLISRIFPGSS